MPGTYYLVVYPRSGFSPAMYDFRLTLSDNTPFMCGTGVPTIDFDLSATPFSANGTDGVFVGSTENEPNEICGYLVPGETEVIRYGPANDDAIYSGGEHIYCFRVDQSHSLVRLVNNEGADMGVDHDYFLLGSLGITADFDGVGDGLSMVDVANDVLSGLDEEGVFRDDAGDSMTLVTLLPGVDYYLVIDANNEVSGSYDVDLEFETLCPPPASTVDPVAEFTADLGIIGNSSSLVDINFCNTGVDFSDARTASGLGRTPLGFAVFNQDGDPVVATNSSFGCDFDDDGNSVNPMFYAPGNYVLVVANLNYRAFPGFVFRTFLEFNAGGTYSGTAGTTNVPQITLPANKRHVYTFEIEDTGLPMVDPPSPIAIDLGTVTPSPDSSEVLVTMEGCVADDSIYRRVVSNVFDSSGLPINNFGSRFGCSSGEGGKLNIFLAPGTYFFSVHANNFNFSSGSTTAPFVVENPDTNPPASTIEVDVNGTTASVPYPAGTNNIWVQFTIGGPCNPADLDGDSDNDFDDAFVFVSVFNSVNPSPAADIDSDNDNDFDDVFLFVESYNPNACQ